MDFLRKRFEASPVFVRAAPFVVFLLLTFTQGEADKPNAYWMYFVKTAVGAWLVWEMRPFVAEMRWAFSWEAVVVGVGVCVMWVGLDGFYPKFSQAGAPWNPHAVFGRNSGMAWLFIAVRVLGSSLVVPPLEEVFYRSFIYRYLVKTDFQAMPMGRFHGLSFVITSAAFGFEHYQWLAGILCGMAYQWLVLRKQRLGDAMTAHAITNLLLGLWVFWRNDWKFW
jgi:CAAX prenyl protease-like protein